MAQWCKDTLANGNWVLILMALKIMTLLTTNFKGFYSTLIEIFQKLLLEATLSVNAKIKKSLKINLINMYL